METSPPLCQKIKCGKQVGNPTFPLSHPDRTAVHTARHHRRASATASPHAGADRCSVFVVGHLDPLVRSSTLLGRSSTQEPASSDCNVAHNDTSACVALHARSRLSTLQAHADISIHLWTRLAALIMDGSCFLIVSQAWPTKKSSIPPLRCALSRLREGSSLGAPNSAKTTSMAEACERAAKSRRLEWLDWKWR